VEWNENKAGTIESSLTEVRDVVQQSTDASKKILVILEAMSKAIRTGLKVCLCSRNVDSNSRSRIPMTRYVTRCSQQVGKN
jgi:hypothetical protein